MPGGDGQISDFPSTLSHRKQNERNGISVVCSERRGRGFDWALKPEFNVSPGSDHLMRDHVIYDHGICSAIGRKGPPRNTELDVTDLED